MCQECGCSKPSPYQVGERLVDHHEHTHTHTLPDGTVITHSHDHVDRGDAQEHRHFHAHQILNLNTSVLSANDRAAERNRGAFKAMNLLTLNVVSSPGAGKTTLLTKTINELKGQLRCGVIVGDLATDNDAARLRTTGAPVVQIATGTLCHLEAGMVAEAMKQLDLGSLDLLFIENVGNLVCPASFDLGEARRVVLHSVTEGEDKPLKYPPMFHSADAVVITKMDMTIAAGFDRSLALENIQQSAPRARLFELSSRNGTGIKTWCDYLVETHASAKSSYQK